MHAYPGTMLRRSSRSAARSLTWVLLGGLSVGCARPSSPVTRAFEREGVRYVRATPAVRNVMLLVGALSLTVINFNIIIPYYARVVFAAREAEFGLLSAAFGVGAIAGALWQASKPNPLRNLRLGGVILLVSTVLLAFTPGPALAAPIFAVCGFGMLSLLVSANSTVQLTIPDHLRGRVMSLYSFVLIGMGPPGALISSRLIDRAGWLGPRWGLVVLAGLGALALLLLWRRLPRELTPPQERPVSGQPTQVNQG